MHAKCSAGWLFMGLTAIVGLSAATARAVELADLRGNFQAATVGSTTMSLNAGTGILDTAGTGRWNFYSATGAGGTHTLLTYQNSIGNGGFAGYRGNNAGANFDMPAISVNRIFNDGITPPAGAVNVHPNNASPLELVTRWTAGQSGLMNIAASLQDVAPSGNGIDYTIRRNGVNLFPVVLSGSAGRIDGSNLLVNVTAGDTIDLVVGPNGAGQYGADESHAKFHVSALSGTLVANLGGDYKETAQPFSATGTGNWSYFASDNINIGATPNEVPMTVKAIGGAGNTGWGATGTSNMPAINDGLIYSDGEPRMANEVSVHPGENGNPHEYAVMRWTAGTGEAGMANIVGNFRNPVIGGDSIDFHVLVDGVSIYDYTATASTTPLTFFDLTTPVVVGSTVDFVLGNNTAGYAADESVIAAFISVQAAVPEPSSIVLWTMMIVGLVSSAHYFRRKA